MKEARRTITFYGPDWLDRLTGIFIANLNLYGESPNGEPLKIVLKMEPHQVEYLAKELQAWAALLKKEAIRMASSIGEVNE